MKLEPSALERWFTTHPGPYSLSLGSAAITPWTSTELARWLPIDWPGEVDWGYAEPEGDPALRELIAAELGLPGREHVLLTAGAVEANFLALTTLLGPGDEAVVQTPSYPQLANVAAATGATVLPWHFEADVDGQNLEKLLSPRTCAVAINTPHNPTGWLAGPGCLSRLAATLRARPGAALLIDEVYGGMGVASSPSVLQQLGNARVLISHSTSKAWALPGMRVGWLAGDAALIREAVVWREQTSLALASPATAAIRALWPHREAMMAETQVVLARNRAAVLAWLAERPWLQGTPSPHAGCFLLGLVGSPLADLALAEAWYRDKRVLAIPGITLGYPGTLRIGFGYRHPGDLHAALQFLDENLRGT